jgi:hypothetical protein
MPTTRYREERLELPPKLVFSVFSDGLLDVLPQPDLAGKQAFLRMLFGRTDVTAEGVRKELQLDGRPLPDDVAMLIIKRGGT